MKWLHGAVMQSQPGSHLAVSFGSLERRNVYPQEVRILESHFRNILENRIH